MEALAVVDIALRTGLGNSAGIVDQAVENCTCDHSPRSRLLVEPVLLHDRPSQIS